MNKTITIQILPTGGIGYKRGAIFNVAKQKTT